MFIRVCEGRKKSEKFVSTKGTIEDASKRTFEVAVGAFDDIDKLITAFKGVEAFGKDGAFNGKYDIDASKVKDKDDTCKITISTNARGAEAIMPNVTVKFVPSNS